MVGSSENQAQLRLAAPGPISGIGRHMHVVVHIGHRGWAQIKDERLVSPQFRATSRVVLQRSSGVVEPVSTVARPEATPFAEQAMSYRQRLSEFRLKDRPNLVLVENRRQGTACQKT